MDQIYALLLLLINTAEPIIDDSFAPLVDWLKYGKYIIYLLRRSSCRRANSETHMCGWKSTVNWLKNSFDANVF